MAIFVPLLNSAAIAAGLVQRNVDIVQAYGLAKASGGTHAAGTCLDVIPAKSGQQWVLDFCHIAMGLGAIPFPRGDVGGIHWDNSFTGNDHIHIALDCACSPNPARYQISAALAGYDGLGAGGMSAKYPLLLNSPWKSFTQLNKERKDMQLSDEDIAKIANAVAERVFNASVNRSGLTLGLVTQKLANFLGMTK